MVRLKHHKTILCALVFVTACATSTKQLQLAMTPRQVTDQLGLPDGQRVQDGFTIYTYTDRRLNSFPANPVRADIHVVFDSAQRVVAYGPGEVRVNQAQRTVVIVPLPR